ncbi:MAG: diguanylate cyclase [Magnetococcales bacterium]|nr:diguanylate cyclase [Magnetococcales bacterium]
MPIKIEGPGTTETLATETDVLIDFVSELARSNRRYSEWWADLNKLIIFGEEKCGVSQKHADKCDLCRFLAEVTDSDIRDSIPFKRLCAQHKRVHDMAADFLRRRETGVVTVADYERLKNIGMKHLYNMDQIKHSSFFSIAHTDNLTGLLTRDVMEDALKEQDDRGRRLGQRFCVALADLDHFKRINDTYGHQVGDTVLVEIARIFEVFLRPYDDAFRYGGEEFLVLLPETTINKAVNVMDRLREEVKTKVICADEHKISMTISVGISESSPGQDIEALISTADENLYKAKSGGRDRVVC